MYLKFHRLREYPFSITCDERYFYESSVHAEALANMMYTIQQRKGMVLVTGEVGSGKTFVGNVLASRLGPGCLTLVLSNPPQSGKQLIRALATRTGMKVRNSADKLSLTEDLEEHLTRLHKRGRLVALFLDEAQDLSNASLEELRLLWNWEDQGDRLIQIVLSGLPELRSRLLEPKWEPLRQRVVLSYHLGPLARRDTIAYVRHRLRVAADDGCLAEFSDDAMADIYAATNGIPRLINVLCDNALLVGYARGRHRVDKAIINEVLRDMTCWGLNTSARTSTDSRSEPPTAATGSHPESQTMLVNLPREPQTVVPDVPPEPETEPADSPPRTQTEPAASLAETQRVAPDLPAESETAAANSPPEPQAVGPGMPPEPQPAPADSLPETGPVAPELPSEPQTGPADSLPETGPVAPDMPLESQTGPADSLPETEPAASDFASESQTAPADPPPETQAPAPGSPSEPQAEPTGSPSAAGSE